MVAAAHKVIEIQGLSSQVEIDAAVARTLDEAVVQLKTELWERNEQAELEVDVTIPAYALQVPEEQGFFARLFRLPPRLIGTIVPERKVRQLIKLDVAALYSDLSVVGVQPDSMLIKIDESGTIEVLE